MKTVKSNDLALNELKRYNSELAAKMDAQVLILRAPMTYGTDDAVRTMIEKLRAQDSTKTRLVVVVETTGGFIEVVERIYAVFRQHYTTVEFVIPNYTYSAGTVLVLSGDEIHMDYYSILGPIDPQYQNEAGELVPGMGYLAKYKELLAEINSGASATPPKATDGELAYLIKKFDPAKLFAIEQACAHAVSLLKVWLPRHKFKDWNVTETSKTPVTPAMREDRAKTIAEILGNPERWNSHGRGIGIRDLEGDEIKLKIKDFGKDTDLSNVIREYYELFVDFGKASKTQAALHSQMGYRRLS